MERLKYIIEDRTIAELLGVQNFTNKESAILELVKNAFDAQATNLDVIFKNKELIISDNGNGMNAEDIKKHWMHVGKSNKDYEIIDNDKKKRVLAGSKGVGRFALSRLGENIQLFSQKNNYKDKSILWITDWNQSNLNEIEPLDRHGTKIIIRNLRDKWNRSNIIKLSDYLSRTYNDDLMKINIISDDFNSTVKRYFLEPKLGHNCISQINLKYSSNDMNLICKVISDEFKDEAQQYVGDIDLKCFEKKISILDELDNPDDSSMSKNELEEILGGLGNFSAEFYFSLKEALSKDVEKFFYKYSSLPGKYIDGIVLYRNSFSISSYDGTKDWLELGKRSRKSPAAATHPTGSWRVRENQLSGKVIIDKRINCMLSDLSNRQGLHENIYYENFIKIIDIGITIFERYRQDIIRKINKKNTIKGETEKKVVDKIIKNPNSIKDLSKDEVIKFVTEVKEFKKENYEYKKEMNSTEKRYKYDIRILNVLATSGLKATSIAHEMHNDRNSIDENCDNIIDALKQYNLWHIINSEERTKYAYSNIPELLEKNRKVNSKIVAFMDTILTEVEKNQFFAEEHDVLELLNNITTVWQRDYAWVDIKLDLIKDLYFKVPEDIVRVIFDNLILNSIQQNDDSNHLIISIKAQLDQGYLKFAYIDNGKGLNKKYRDDPMKILEVHETSRKRGHGLGMWIVNNTIVMSGGEITNIDGLSGFKIEFTLGGKI